MRTALRPLPAPSNSSRSVLVAVALWAFTGGPFAFGAPRLGLPAVLIGALVTLYVVVAGRRLPIVALGTAAVATLFDWRYAFALAFASHVAGWRVGGERLVPAVFALIAVLGTGLTLTSGFDLYDSVIRLGVLSVFGFLPWLIGIYRRQRSALLHAGWERAAQLEQQQRIVADQARLRERARIAHDMHDFLGHHLSLAALQAGALELAPGIADQHAAKAGALRSSIAAATEQLREITSVLRDDGDPVPIAPVNESIRQLVGRLRAAGLDVRLEVSAELDRLEPMHHRAAYRMVQEALTNVTKHAPGATVLVRLASLPDALEILVVNGPATAAPAADGAGGRTGLLGLRERARLLGGTVESGPTGSGFKVVMRLPHDHSRTTAEPVEPSSQTVVHDFDRGRSRVQRSLLVAVLGPTAVGALLVLTLMGLYAYDTFTSVLPPEQFERITIGDSRALLSDVLPRRQVPERGFGPSPPEPQGAHCEYYRSTAGFLPSAFDVYRLCFREGRLVAKDTLPR